MIKSIPSLFTSEESRVIHKAMRLLESKSLRAAPVLNYFQDFERYLMLRFAGQTNEQGHVLYLSDRRSLLAAEIEALGSQASVVWDMRRIVRRAIELGADYVVFAHNHPNGTLGASDADIRCHEFQDRTLAPFSIGVLDSFVVTDKGICSVKQQITERNERDTRERLQRMEVDRVVRQVKRLANKAAKIISQPEGVFA